MSFYSPVILGSFNRTFFPRDKAILGFRVEGSGFRV